MRGCNQFWLPLCSPNPTFSLTFPSRLSVTLLALPGGVVFPGWWCCVVPILFCLVILVLFFLGGRFDPPVTFAPSWCRIALPIQVCRLVLGELVRLGRAFSSWEGDYVRRWWFGDADFLVFVFCWRTWTCCSSWSWVLGSAFSALPAWGASCSFCFAWYFGSVLFASALLSVNSPCDLSVSRILHFSVPFHLPVWGSVLTF